MSELWDLLEQSDFEEAPAIESGVAPKSELWDILDEEVAIQEPEYDVLGGLGVLAEGVTHIPQQVASSVLSAIRGGDIDTDIGWSDEFINQAKRESRQLEEKHKKSAKDYFLPGIPIESVSRLPQQIGFTLTSMLAGLGVGVPLALAPDPTLMTKIGAWAAGTAATGSVAYRMAKDQFVNDLFDMLNEQAIENKGRKLAESEWDEIKNKYESHSTKYGLWEAIPEALGQALSLGIIRLPVGKFLKVPGIKNRFLNTLTKGAGKFAAIQAEEHTTEGITGLKQSQIEAEAGLRDKPYGSFLEAVKEQAPDVALLTGIMAGGGAIGSRLYDRAVRPRVEPTQTLDDILDEEEAGPPPLTPDDQADIIQRGIQAGPGTVERDAAVALKMRQRVAEKADAEIADIEAREGRRETLEIGLRDILARRREERVEDQRWKDIETELIEQQERPVVEPESAIIPEPEPEITPEEVEEIKPVRTFVDEEGNETGYFDLTKENMAKLAMGHPRTAITRDELDYAWDAVKAEYPDLAKPEKAEAVKPLIEEAKKYNTAEEFVEKENYIDSGKIKTQSGHPLDNLPISAKPRLIHSSLFKLEKEAFGKTGDNIAYHQRDISEGDPSKTWNRNYWVKQIKKGERPPILVESRDGQLRVSDGNHRLTAYFQENIKEIPVIFDKSVKSQLTDIWNKAQAKPQPAALPKPKPPEAATEDFKGETIPKVGAKDLIEKANKLHKASYGLKPKNSLQRLLEAKQLYQEAGIGKEYENYRENERLIENYKRRLGIEEKTPKEAKAEPDFSKMPLKDITVKTKAIREKTGETVIIQENAETALKDADSEISTLEKILNCL